VPRQDLVVIKGQPRKIPYANRIRGAFVVTRKFVAQQIRLEAGVSDQVSLKGRDGSRD
jgi:hypothetical protein